MARSGKNDAELEAMSTILEALNGLDGESVNRVLDYVFSRLSITSRSRPAGIHQIQETKTPVSDSIRPRKPSIRDLKEEKKPDSSNQMAALVAYYLSEIAAPDEQKQTVGATDIERYFKQAGFKLPGRLAQTLPNAAAAGYFDSEGGGQYRLNAVGYNLVVHGLPRQHNGENPTRKMPRKPRKQSKKP